jgi:small conductance mechanosensitive channel
MRYWVPTKQYFQILYQANLAVYNALAQAGITIPFPQRDIHMLSGNQC